MVTILQLGCLRLAHLQWKRGLVKISRRYTKTRHSLGTHNVFIECHIFPDSTNFQEKEEMFNNHFHINYREVEATIEHLSIPPENSERLKFSSTYSQHIMSQFTLCLWKQNLVYWRSPAYNAVRLFFTTLSAIIIGTIFWDVGSKR